MLRTHAWSKGLGTDIVCMEPAEVNAHRFAVSAGGRMSLDDWLRF